MIYSNKWMKCVQKGLHAQTNEWLFWTWRIWFVYVYWLIVENKVCFLKINDLSTLLMTIWDCCYERPIGTNEAISFTGYRPWYFLIHQFVECNWQLLVVGAFTVQCIFLSTLPDTKILDRLFVRFQTFWQSNNYSTELK